MHEENYTLKWHTYSDHLRDILQEMSSDDSFADVTLVTDDKKQIKAHRNILSACSSVFKDILQINTNNNHPVIYLRGIQHSEMESILQFIYLGEANFYEERINEFLTVAKNLDFRDLAECFEDGDSTAVKDDTNTKTEESPIEADDVGASKQDIEVAKGQHQTPGKAVTKKYNYECHQCDKVYNYGHHLARHIKSVHEGVKYACNQCDYQATKLSSLTQHIQSVHEGVKYACTQCGNQYTEQGTLTKHIQSQHEGVKYACNQCSYQATAQNHLKTHIEARHEGVKYACTQCGNQYTEQGTLTKHIQSQHEGVKYACNQCSYQATAQNHLKTHIEARHEGVKYACNQCHYQGSKDALRHHLKQKHS